MRPYISLATLAAAFLALCLAPAALAYEAFKVANPHLGALSSKPIAVSTSWAAYFQSTGNSTTVDKSQLVVMDTTTRQVLHTIPVPAARTPIAGLPDGYFRTPKEFGIRLATDGTYLAVLSSSTIERLSEEGAVIQTKSATSIYVWKMPGAQPIGVVDIDSTTSSNSAFIGVGNGRVIYTRSGLRTIQQWDAQTLAPLTPATIADTLPTIDTDFLGHSMGAYAMAGDDFVFSGRDDSRTHLVHVKLSTGSVTDLPTTGYEGRSFRYLAVGGGHLLAPVTAATSGGATVMLHYDLATAQVVAETPVPPLRRAFPYFAPDGASWAAVLYPADGSPFLLYAGAEPATPGSSLFEMPRETESLIFTLPFDKALAYAQGYLWLRGGIDAEGTVAYRLPAADQPIATITGRALPCQESDGHLKVTFTLSKPVDRTISMKFRTRFDVGSATHYSDYLPWDGTLHFEPNQTQVEWDIPIVQDQIVEENESLVIEIGTLSNGVVAPDPLIPTIIGGSSFHRLPTVGAWKDPGPLLRARPHSIAVAGDHLVQTNASGDFAIGDAPRVLTRPLDGGQWTPSVSLADIPEASNDIFTNDAGLAFLSTSQAVRIYEPATDTLRYKTPSTPSNNPQVYAGDTHFIVNSLGSTVYEYPLTPPFTRRFPSGASITNMTNAAYAQNVLIGSFGTSLPDGGLHMISRTTGADLGQFIPGWRTSPDFISASGNLFACATPSRAWFRFIDQPGQLIPLIPVNGPLLRITGVRVSGNRILVNDIPTDAPPSIRIFETPSGIEIGMLLADRQAATADVDFSTYLPEGFPVQNLPWYDAAKYSLKNLTLSGNNIVAAIRWPHLHASRDLVAARFLQETGLPGIIDPAPISEVGGNLSFTLTEAAPFPLTITTRAVTTWMNDSADWTDSGSTVVIPAGATAFTPTMQPVNDQLPEDTVASPIDITISGNGLTRTIRTAVKVVDDDQVPTLAYTVQNYPISFAPVAGGWAYRAPTSNLDHLISWSGDENFTHGTSFGTAGNAGFANAIASTGGWLAVAQDAFAISSKKSKPSQIQIYQPATAGNKPVRILKGLKDVNRFGKTLYARDKTLWVAAPGSSVSSPKPKVFAGQVLQYDLPTGKKTRTYKAPKATPLGFGSSITANDTSVWIGAPFSNGTIFQYDRAKGKLLRTIETPNEVGVQNLGDILAATNSGLLLASSTYTTIFYDIYGYSESTGQRLWELHAPDGRRFSSFTLIGDDILVGASDSLIFYRLSPTAAPELLFEVLVPHDLLPAGTFRISEIAASNSQLAIRCYQNSIPILNEVYIFDLAQFEKLLPYLPNLPASLTDTPDLTDATGRGTIITPPLPPVLTVTQSTGGQWQLQLPSPAEAAATSTTVQVSTDLNEWKPLATPTPDGTTWQLLPGTPLESAAALTNGTTLQVPPKLPQLFFRLHTP